jgi:hypothetical protein
MWLIVQFYWHRSTSSTKDGRMKMNPVHVRPLRRNLRRGSILNIYSCHVDILLLHASHHGGWLAGSVAWPGARTCGPGETKTLSCLVVVPHGPFCPGRHGELFSSCDLASISMMKNYWADSACPYEQTTYLPTLVACRVAKCEFRITLLPIVVTVSGLDSKLAMVVLGSEGDKT